MKLSDRRYHTVIASEINKISQKEFINRYPHDNGKVFLFNEDTDSQAFTAFNGGLGIGFQDNSSEDITEYRFRVLWIDCKKFLDTVKELWEVSLDEIDNNFCHIVDYVTKVFKSLNLHKIISQNFFQKGLKTEIPVGRYEGIFWVGNCAEWYYSNDTDTWDQINSLSEENPTELESLIEIDDPRMFSELLKFLPIERIKTIESEDPRLIYEIAKRLEAGDLEKYYDHPDYIIRRLIVKKVPKEDVSRFTEDQDKEVRLTAYIRLLNEKT
jgi:hypothetical protein